MTQYLDAGDGGSIMPPQEPAPTSGGFGVSYGGGYSTQPVENPALTHYEGGLGQVDSGIEPSPPFGVSYGTHGGYGDTPPPDFGVSAANYGFSGPAPEFGVSYGVTSYADQYSGLFTSPAPAPSSPAPQPVYAYSDPGSGAGTGGAATPAAPTPAAPTAPTSGGSTGGSTAPSTPSDPVLDALLTLINKPGAAPPLQTGSGGGVYQKSAGSSGNPVVLIVCVIGAGALVAYYLKSKKKGKGHGHGHDHGHSTPVKGGDA